MARNESSKVSNMDHRFALVDTDGVERYPYRTHRKDGQFGFVLGRDLKGKGSVAHTLEEVVRAVVFDGQQVRASDYPASRAKASSRVSLSAKRVIQGYRIDPSLRHLVVGAPVQSMGHPEGELPRQRTSVGRVPHIPATPEATSVARVDSLELLDGCSVGAFADALREVESLMTDAQLEMLRGHANAPAQELSMQSIAELGGYADYETANIQYGGLGRMFAKALRVDPGSLTNKVQAVCVPAERTDAAGHFVWRLRPQLAKVLYQAGWLEPDPAASDDPAVAGALAEATADASYQALPETTRRALINARIGQGGYRQRMLKVWDGRCAVTGLGIQEALTASHAMAWKESDNRQRLDEYNGLLLSATLDRLFDRGLISFSNSGELLARSHLATEELAATGLAPSPRLRFVPTRCLPYLTAHRQRFGFETRTTKRETPDSPSSAPSAKDMA